MDCGLHGKWINAAELKALIHFPCMCKSPHSSPTWLFHGRFSIIHEVYIWARHSTSTSLPTSNQLPTKCPTHHPLHFHCTSGHVQCSMLKSSPLVKCHFGCQRRPFFLGTSQKCAMQSGRLSNNFLAQNTVVAICRSKHNWTSILTLQWTLPNSNNLCNFDSTLTATSAWQAQLTICERGFSKQKWVKIVIATWNTGCVDVSSCHYTVFRWKILWIGLEFSTLGNRPKASWSWMMMMKCTL